MKVIITDKYEKTQTFKNVDICAFKTLSGNEVLHLESIPNKDRTESMSLQFSKELLYKVTVDNEMFYQWELDTLRQAKKQALENYYKNQIS